MKPTKKELNQFKAVIWGYYHAFGRQFPWRNIDDPYKIFVSEVMLQQTQTHRVVEKYEIFTQTFASFEELAGASLREVLSLWQGLGYNRRGKYLHESAKLIVAEYNGALPDDPEKLKTFPGIGPGTAGSLAAFAFNKPTVFIETNIRSVFIHCFFQDQKNVQDSELLALIKVTVCKDNPREWYYALMDYGVMLKKKFPNPNRKSAHHTSQSKFEGSDRQIRGMIIKILAEFPHMTLDELQSVLNKDKDRIKKILCGLTSDKMIKKCGDRVQIC